MITIEKNPTCTKNKILTKANANSDRSFIETSTELLRKGHHVKFRAPGDSMYPTICDGDIVTVMPIETGSISIGDILLYRHKSGVTAHRVIHLAKGGTHHSQYSTPVPHSSGPSPHYVFFLRGDAALVFDDPVSADRILGKVTLVEREGRRIDPYCLRIKLHYKTRRFGSRIKRLLRHFDSLSA